MRVILASASPRRKELLGRLFDTFEVIAATEEEACDIQLPEQLVMQLSSQKAHEVEKRLYQNITDKDDYIIIGADTVVAYQGKILGKPQNEEHAAAMLSMLAADVHQVFTGVTLCYSIHGINQVETFYEKTEVSFYPMTEKEIADYINTKEPMDKAGAYGIQGIGGRFVRQVAGDYNNVVGLPLARLYQVLKSLPQAIELLHS